MGITFMLMFADIATFKTTYLNCWAHFKYEQQIEYDGGWFCLLADSGTRHPVCLGEKAHFSPPCPRISQHRRVISSAKMYSTNCLICWTSEWLLHKKPKHCAETAKTCFSDKNINQLFFLCLLLCFRSAMHSVQPIELNFTDSPTDGSAGNTIQISMDCITMHEPDETLSVST